MIQAIYYRDENRVTVEGHAYSGEPGSDLVCAAASILVYTLATNLEEMEHQGIITNVFKFLEPGIADIKCDVDPEYTSYAARIIEAVCVGFELLAMDYSDFVNYEVQG